MNASTVALLWLPSDRCDLLSETAARASLPASSPLCEMVFGEENRLFLHGLESVLDQLPGLYNPVVIIGPSGRGKTRALSGVLMHWKTAGQEGVSLANKPDQRLSKTNSPKKDSFNQKILVVKTLFITGNHLERLIRHHLAHESIELLLHEWSQLHLLIIDDFDRVVSASVWEVIGRVVDLCLNGSCQLMVSLHHSLENSSTIPSRIVSRLESGLVISIAAPNLLVSQRLVEFHACRIECEPSKEARDIIAKTLVFPGAIALFFDLLKNSEGFTPSQSLDATRAAALLLGKIPAAGAAPTIKQLIAVTATYFKVLPCDLVGPSRRRVFAHARSVAMYLARHLTDASLVSIGRAFGNRDHTTVLYSVRIVAARAAKNATDRCILSDLFESLSSTASQRLSVEKRKNPSPVRLSHRYPK